MRARKVLPAFIAAGVLFAACGDDSKDSSPATTAKAATGATTAAPGGATTTTAAPTAVDPALAPLKIGLLGIETGALATANRHNSIELAIAELNAKGGAYGHKIEYTAYDAGSAADTASTAVKKAISDKMNVMVGLGFTATVAAVAPDVANSGIPLLFTAQNPILNKSQLKSDIGLRVGPTADIYAEAFVRYALEQTPAPKSIGNFHTTDQNSAFVGKAVNQLLKDKGFTGTVVERGVSATATDVTEAVLAMKAVDFIIMNDNPTQGQLFLKQKAQNGLTIPGVIDAGAVSYVSSGANTVDQMKNQTIVSSCSIEGSDFPAAVSYKNAYKAKYPSETNADGSGPGNYQAVYMIAAAANLAKSIDAKDLKTAFKTIDYTGPCGQWKADAENNMQHDVTVIDATTFKQIKRYTQLVGTPGLQVDVPTTAAAAATTAAAASTAAAS